MPTHENKTHSVRYFSKRETNDGFTGVGAAIFYGLTSVSMAFLNKVVINTYEFNFPFFILGCQMLITVVYIEIFCYLGKINVPQYTWKSAKMFMLPSLSYATHSALALMALEGMNIPMYTAIKRCVPLVNLVLSVILLKRPMPSCMLVFSIFIITFGCIIAVLGDATFDKVTYSFGLMSVLAQGVYLTLVQKSSENHFSTLEILQLNSYNTLLPFFTMSILLGEPSHIVNNKYLDDTGFYTVFFLLISLGAVLTYSLFLCTVLTSALTTSLVAVGKSVIQTLVGFFVFGGVSIRPLNITGIMLNMVGGFVYTYVKYKEKTNKSSKQVNPSSVIENGDINNQEKLLSKTNIENDIKFSHEYKTS